jgi:acetoacetyl-CoA synthetase
MEILLIGYPRCTGGTDICSLFAGMCSALPVYRGEIQCRLLGMAIETYTENGAPSRPGDAGELVCLQPFPCQPVGFWPIQGFGTAEAVEAAMMRYQQAYFSTYPEVWCTLACFLVMGFRAQ